MSGDVNGSKKGMSAGAQTVAAVVAVGGLLATLWAVGERSQATADAGKPAVCSPVRSAPPTSEFVSGAQLCKALNRPDLPTLLGTPTDQAQNAWGSDGSVEHADGSKTATPAANVVTKAYTVKLTSSYDRFPVAQLTGLLGSTAQKQTVLGHPAVLYSDRTIKLQFSLGGGKSSSGPGVVTRSLLVAKDAKDGGGSFEIVLWRQDGLVPEDAAVLRVAEQVLPTVPGWSAA
ncbi:DUF6215 domain-containing protein [Streptomyces sp. G-G2]|uniref:DUF6215 domain-containing protein n=1 Tax=Streptomyces sp. G-G2 TaxID=3046201 RepID=UPI0024BB434D|nr:DUF6215 domain-containing protein [Streptomyces sp. G-G2]MDJ0381921.1 DUF6215 domain-containing protein [Streptomyces sp. G-G2]